MQMPSRKSQPGRGTPWNSIRLLRVACLLLCLSLFTASCLADDAESASGSDSGAGWEIDEWYIYTSLYTHHWNPSPEHNNHQKMLGLELHMKNRWLFGLTSFDNSYDQRSEYLYAGYPWSLFGSSHWYFKLTGGLMYGYKEPYEDKIPFNGLGVAPVIMPTFGFRWRSLVTELNIGGTAVINVTAGIAF